MDIGSIVSERLAAMRKLTENPNDIGALNAMHRAQNEVKKTIYRNNIEIIIK